MASSVGDHRGSPALFLDGRPTFPAYLWTGTPGVGQWPGNGPVARRFAEAGVHLYAFDVGTTEWVGPAPGRTGHVDFSGVGPRFEQVLSFDPGARFHLRVHLEAQKWWWQLYPEECERLSTGERVGQSFASRVWREEAKDFLRAYIAHIASLGLADRMVAYQTGAGGTGEWCKGSSAFLPTADYSEPMRRWFRAWLRGRYGDDRGLRDAWSDPEAALDAAEVPEYEAQHEAQHLSFRDPRREQRVIDYYRSLADLCADLIIDFTSTVKEATGGKALAGAFYGYLLDLAWNDAFWGARVGGGLSAYQRSGHLGLRKVLASHSVDFVVSPYSYGFRGIGGEGSPMPPAEAAKAHGKICIVEDDTRTHVTDTIDYGKVDTPARSEAVLKRNFAEVLVRSLGIWWLGVGSGHVNLEDAPELRPLLRQFVRLGAFSMELDRGPCAEIAVLLDDESFFVESLGNGVDLPAVFLQHLTGLARLGAPHDVHLLQDFIEGRLPPYRLYLLPNCFWAPRERRRALGERIRTTGGTYAWVYAPGYIAEEPSLESMRELTGFRFGSCGSPWGPTMHVTDFSHPITRGLPQDLFWGSTAPIGPLFHLEDPEARILGQVFHSIGRCLPGLGVKELDGWTSVYAAAPNLPAALLRGLARFAGVHLYSEDGDVLYAGRQLLAVHTAGGGERLLRLPRTVEVVHDLFAGTDIAREASEFRVALPPASTSLWYVGDRATLARGKAASASTA